MALEPLPPDRLTACDIAEAALELAITELFIEHDLSPRERIRVLTGVLGSLVRRHGARWDPEADDV